MSPKLSRGNQKGTHPFPTLHFLWCEPQTEKCKLECSGGANQSDKIQYWIQGFSCIRELPQPQKGHVWLTLHQPREDQNSTSTLPFNDFVLILDSIQKRQLDDPRYGRPNIKGARVPREPMTGSTYPCHRLKAGNPQAIWGGQNGIETPLHQVSWNLKTWGFVSSGSDSQIQPRKTKSKDLRFQRISIPLIPSKISNSSRTHPPCHSV